MRIPNLLSTSGLLLEAFACGERVISFMVEERDFLSLIIARMTSTSESVKTFSDLRLRGMAAIDAVAWVIAEVAEEELILRVEQYE
jgi:hypothetical protein